MKNETLVIGASLNSNRYSYMAIKRLRAKEIAVRAIGIKTGWVQDVQVLEEKVPFQNIDTVTLYLNPKRQESYYDYIISLQPRRVIFNPGTENPDFENLLNNHEIQFEVACTLVLLSVDQY